MDNETIARRARRRQAALERARRDPRYRRALGRYLAAGVLATTEDVTPYRYPIAIADALWAGRVEPRILELLPALIVKRPSLFIDLEPMPDDLLAAVGALRKNQRPDAFRGIPGAALLRWLPAVGHKNKLPTQLRSFRLRVEDLDLLDRLAESQKSSRTQVLRRALRELADRIL